MAQAAIQTTDLATGKSMVLMHAALGDSQYRLEWCGYTHHAAPAQRAMNRSAEKLGVEHEL